MTASIRNAALLAAVALLGAGSAMAFPGPPNISPYTVPCAIVLVGHDYAATAADPYGEFTVGIRDSTYSQVPGATVIIDFSACCPGIELSNTQLGAGVSHVTNSTIVTAITDATGTATFRVEGAASGASGPPPGAIGCASISVMLPGGQTILITNSIDRPTVLVATPDLAGAVGSPGVDITDLSFFISDKNSFAVSNANYCQRSDFDYHLPVFNCSAVFNASAGFGVNLGDLGQWIAIKNAARSFSNGPFPASCP